MSSHKVLTLFYTNAALEPSECHLADGWGPAKREETTWDTVWVTRPVMVSGTKKPLWLVAQYALRCKRPLG